MFEFSNLSAGSVALTVAAVLPAIILCVYIFRMDRAEKEPLPLLGLLLLGGALSVIPILIFEELLSGVLDSAFAPFATIEDGVWYFSPSSYAAYNFLLTFVAVALVEEGFKWIALYIITSKSKHFNSLFDGIIYAVFVSLGFAIVENIKYVFSYGMSTAFLRAFTSIPGHMFFGVVMGYFYSMRHIEKKARELEDKLRRRGYINGASRFSPGRDLVLSLLIPIILHGFYDFCCYMKPGDNGLIFFGLFLIFLALLYVICFRLVSKMSKRDMPDSHSVPRMFFGKYPNLFGMLREEDFILFK